MSGSGSLPEIRDNDIDPTNTKMFRNKLIAAMIGNAIEFYDYNLIGTLADVFGNVFFPGSDEKVQLLLAYVVFGAAFLMRAFGGGIIGKLGDIYGRKKALQISILMMLIPSCLVGCLPTFNQAGYVAIVLLFLLRLFQGSSSTIEFLVYTIST